MHYTEQFLRNVKLRKEAQQQHQHHPQSEASYTAAPKLLLKN